MIAIKVRSWRCGDGAANLIQCVRVGDGAAIICSEGTQFTRVEDGASIEFSRCAVRAR